MDTFLTLRWLLLSTAFAAKIHFVIACHKHSSIPELNSHVCVCLPNFYNIKLDDMSSTLANKYKLYIVKFLLLLRKT